MMANVTGMLGVAMGSSQPAGYVSREGGPTAWLNELAFAPIDLSATAWRDEWSGDVGVGRSTSRSKAPNGLGQSELLLELQRLMAADDPRARSVYETIGVYLGYGLLQYRRFYDFGHLLLLGRVTSGGGEVIEAATLKVLDVEAAGVPQPVFHRASERDKRHGQAVAGASLPQIAH